ncbi:MAG: hypothetical protein JZU64_18385 [Rhodoferax sp.]|jgi:hypothetical protein|nr:hypothetical protein [Rhodoferax sp.]
MHPNPKTEPFDLNDIENEPSDEQLQSLMDAVAAQARQRAEVAMEAFYERLRVEMIEARNRQAAA